MPKPCRCCDTKTEEWWIYCAICGYHIAANNDPSERDRERASRSRRASGPLTRLRAAKKRLEEATEERAAAEAEWDAALKAFDKIDL